MFNNVVLDVFIGLVFIYFLYSLLAATLQEMIARLFASRGRMLVQAIARMLEDHHDKKIFGFSSDDYTLVGFIASFIRDIKRFFRPFVHGDNSFAKAFFNSPSIKYLAENSWNSKPSYIEASTFSQTIIQMLRGSAYDGSSPQMPLIKDALFNKQCFERPDGNSAAIDNETLKQLQQLFINAHHDADKFKALLEEWFNQTMDRVTGWYKRRTQFMLFLIGFLVAFLFNVDTVAIYNVLAKDKKAREALVEIAIKAPEKYKPIIDSLNKKVKDSVAIHGKDTIHYKTEYVAASDEYLDNTYKSLAADAGSVNNILALGKPRTDTCYWCADSVYSRDDKKEPDPDKKQYCDAFKKRYTWLQYNPIQKGGWTTLFGWLITACAISLGAPFWFDLLNKLVRLRATGNKPQNDTAAGTNASSAPSTVKRVG